MEFTRGRLLVGLAGREADVPLIRYAAMLTRLSPGHDESAAFASTEPDRTARLPEVRFVQVQRGSGNSLARYRLLLREQVRQHFPALPMHVPVGCDVLRGCPVRRLATFAADFDSDLLLVGQELCPPPLSARLTMAAPCPVWLVPSDWPPLVRRILVPVKMCERDLTTLRTAVHLARGLPRARVLALHVHQEGATIADENVYQQIQRRQQDALATFLAQIADAAGLIEPHLALGMHIPETIASVAQRLSIDLIVLSTRGRSPLGSWLMPSIAERTARCSPASMLVLKTHESPPGFFGALAEKISGPEDLRFN